MEKLKKFLSNIRRWFGVTPSVPTVVHKELARQRGSKSRDVLKDLGLGQIAFAATTNKQTIVVFMGAIPMSYTLGMLMSHTPAICSIVRNMASLLADALPENRDFLHKLATHGNIDPTDQPFAPAVPSAETNSRTAFVAELSYYEAAQMCICVTETKHAFEEAGITDNKSEATFHFWNDVWSGLPDSAKMSVLDVGGSKVAN